MVRYSIEQGLIGPGIRVILGALLALNIAGAGLDIIGIIGIIVTA